MARVLAGLIVQTALFTLLIMAPGWAMIGNLHWPRGWLVVGILFSASAIGGLWVLKTDPALARERAAAPLPQTRADGLATAAIAAAVIVWFLLAIWDARVLHLLPLAPVVSLAAGLVIFLIGLGVIIWVMRVNTFAATVVKVQHDREQRVIDTGPYARVRHPMYAGAIIFFAGVGMMLDSAPAALLAVPLFALAFLPRMLVEEKALHRDLPGYADYQTRVRSRVLPGFF